MKVATWNVNGIRARQAQFAEWVAAERPDVVCLQEIKAKPDQIPESCGLPDYACYWHGAGGYSGVGLHIRTASFAEPAVLSHPPFDLETRIVQADIGDLTIASIYVPNGGKDYAAKVAFLRELAAFAEASHARGRQLILCGDMNVAITDRDVHPKERKPVIGQLPEERDLMNQILDTGLVDLGRAMDPDNDELFTWWAPWRNMKQRNIGWRLDYMLVSEPLARRATSCRVQREVGTSDHGPVVAEFRDE